MHTNSNVVSCIIFCSGFMSLSFCRSTETFIVGFVETAYTVIEGDGQVEVCVNLTSPEGDIGDERVFVEVFTNTDPGSIPADAAAASKLVLFFNESTVMIGVGVSTSTVVLGQ